MALHDPLKLRAIPKLRVRLSREPIQDQMVNRAGEPHQRAIMGRRENSVVHCAEAFPADADEVEAPHGLHGLRREGLEDAQLIEDALAVRLDRLAAKGSRRAWLAFQDDDRDALLRKRQTQNRAATPRAHDNNLELHRQSS
jgi:hypothetical protein